MKRLRQLGSWRRIGLQNGLLAGLAASFVAPDDDANAGGGCPLEDQCSFKKPNVMFLVDYSSSMNAEVQLGQTRWEAAVAMVEHIATANNGFFDESMHLGLMRFGHDPDPASAGTSIPGDASGIIDGQSLDVHWYDPDNAPDQYFECNADALVQFLGQVDPPLCEGVPCSGIQPWTNGALLRTQQLIEATRADHPADIDPQGPRLYANILLTQGLWCSPDGMACADAPNPPAADDPSITSGVLFTNDEVPTYVVSLGDDLGQAEADAIAMAGGTTAAYDGQNDLVMAIEEAITGVIDSVMVPDCIGGAPRIMIVLDASSSMLNVGALAGSMGDTPWDQARDALAGASSIFDAPSLLGESIEDFLHVGLVVFGSPGEQQVLLDYAPCSTTSMAWALDPQTSCGFGCDDPWGGPPIFWTQLGPKEISPACSPIHSHMPKCDLDLQAPGRCSGSLPAAHLGLALASAHAEAYRAAPPPEYPVHENTPFFNVLVTHGDYTGASTDAQVAAVLTDLYENHATTTYVLGVGDDTSVAHLQNLACWGSGGSGIPCQGGAVDHFDSATLQELEATLQQIIESMSVDPCCPVVECLSGGSCSGAREPDPVPPSATTSETSDTAGATSTAGTTMTSSDPTSGGSTSGTSTASDVDTSITSITSSVTNDAPQTSGDATGPSSTADAGCGCAARDRTPFLPAGLLVLVLARARRRNEPPIRAP